MTDEQPDFDELLARTRRQLFEHLREQGIDEVALVAKAARHFQNPVLTPGVITMADEDIQAWAAHEASLNDDGSPAASSIRPAPPRPFAEMWAEGKKLAEAAEAEWASQNPANRIVFQPTGNDYANEGEYVVACDGMTQAPRSMFGHAGYTKVPDPVPALRDTLRAIGIAANIHCAGGAFDPAHMYAISHAAFQAIGRSEGLPVNFANTAYSDHLQTLVDEGIEYFDTITAMLEATGLDFSTEDATAASESQMLFAGDKPSDYIAHVIKELRDTIRDLANDPRVPIATMPIELQDRVYRLSTPV